MVTIGVQLFTVRDLLGEHAEETIRAIGKIGYTTVQLAGDAESIRASAKACKAVGMPICGILASLEVYHEMGEELFSLCKEYEITDLGVSSFFTDLATAKEFVADANAFAKTAAKHGCTFSYHNHGHEFVRAENGTRVMDVFLGGFDPSIKLMPDTYWLHDGGMDVRCFLEQTQGRVDCLHLKDLKRTEEGHTFAEVGRGNLWFEGILQTAKNCGIKTLVVEQDVCDHSPLESIAISYQTVKTILEGIK